jgi:hypothetical protein
LTGSSNAALLSSLNADPSINILSVTGYGLSGFCGVETIFSFLFLGEEVHLQRLAWFFLPGKVSMRDAVGDSLYGSRLLGWGLVSHLLQVLLEGTLSILLKLP